MAISHHVLAAAFGISGNILSVTGFLAPVPTFVKICKNKSTGDFQSLPYLTALFSSMLWLYYALLTGTNIALLIPINSFGCVVEIIYLLIYTIYATSNSRRLTIILFMIMDVGAFSVVFFVTYFVIHGSLRVVVLGWICVVISVCCFAAPLSILVHVIKTKSVEFMPFYLSFSLTLSAIAWFVYGILIKDIRIAIPNVLGFAMGFLQLVIYGIYRNSGTNEEREQEMM